MVTLSVANVGDGACSKLLYGVSYTSPTLLIDCGSSQGGETAINGLRRILETTGENVDVMVVTHMHVDHFNGLLNLKKHPGTKNWNFGDLTLVYPRIPQAPSDKPGDSMGLQFAQRLSALSLFLGEIAGVAELDLANQIRKSCDTLTRKPVSRGDKFNFNGQDFDVLWPPRSFEEGLAKEVQTVVRNFDKLAKKDNGLADALNRVRRSGQVTLETIGQSDRGDVYVEVRGDSEHSENTSRDVATRSSLLHGETVPSGDSFDDGKNGFKEPDQDQKRNREINEVAKQYRNVANEMSLVFSTPERDFVCWGDIPQNTAKKIVAIDTIGPHQSNAVAVILAPHHGSQGPTLSWFDKFVCISQDGPGLHQKRHHGSCRGECYSTHRLDTVCAIAYGKRADVSTRKGIDLEPDRL